MKSLIPFIRTLLLLLNLSVYLIVLCGVVFSVTTNSLLIYLYFIAIKEDFYITLAGGRGGWGGTFHFAVFLSLSSRYYSSSVAKQTASLGSVRLLLSVIF